jgi:hypothetical protein
MNGSRSSDGDSHAAWDEDGARADLYRDGSWIGSLRLVDGWFTPGSREPRAAWVAEWPAERKPYLPTRALVELDGEPALGEVKRTELAELGETLIEDRPASDTPAPFGVGSTTLDSAKGLRDRIEAVSHALQHAEGRLHDAARITEEWGGVKVLTTLTEALAWLRALDDVMKFTWQEFLPTTVRETASKEIDAAVARRSALPDFARDADSERRKTGEPYLEWTLLLLDRGLALSPGDFQGLRWLAGKMLHYGPLPAVELRQIYEGAPPRWTWRSADEIYPDVTRDRRPGQRRLYEAHIAAESMLSKFGLTMMLIEMEHLFFGLIRKTEELSQDRPRRGRPA